MPLKFLIYISYSYALPIGKPLEEEIKSRGQRVLWFADTEEGARALKGSQYYLEGIEEVIDYHPDVVLTITDSVPDFISGLKVQVFHGFNAEKRPTSRGFSHFRIRGFFDLYCTQGPSTTKMFKQQQQKFPHFEVVETGWSKVDPLFPLKERDEHVTPRVFIASTFTERLSLALKETVFSTIKQLAKTGNYDFYMVLHPKLPYKIREKWKALEGLHFSFYDTTHLIPLFKKADIMFSDTTSAIQEFGLQLKPIVTFDHRIPRSYLINVTAAGEIESAFEKALTYPKDVLEKLATYNQNLHPYNDGQSSKRVIDACINTLQADKSHLKKKPLNLVRKLKIRNRLNHFTLKTYRESYTLQPELEKETTEDRLSVTAIIPTGNEVHNIEEVLASVNFCDEIFVIDSFSTDGTFEKAQQLADKVIQREFKYPADQKNWAIPQAKHEWILLLDADERVTPLLRQEILDILKNPSRNDAVAYWIGRKNHFMGKQVKHSGWRNDKVIRLFRKSKCRYEDKQVHEEIEADGKVLKLRHKLYHNTYVSLDNYMEKMNRYASWQANDYAKTTGRLHAYHFVIKPGWRFFKHYIIQGGFRDGIVGLTICYIQAYTVFMRYAKLWLLRRNRK